MRRFVAKETLIDALFEDAIAEVVAIAEAASRHEDPWAGIPFLGQMIADVADSSRDVSPDLFRRYAATVLDGLRVRRDGPARLPVRALSLEQLELIQEAE